MYEFRTQLDLSATRSLWNRPNAGRNAIPSFVAVIVLAPWIPIWPNFELDDSWCNVSSLGFRVARRFWPRDDRVYARSLGI